MKTKNIVTASLFAALICIATMIIKIPTPLGGYANLGDCFVLLAAWIMPPAYAVLAAGIGSALADILSGFVSYAPATLIIKILMALCAYYIFKICSQKTTPVISRIIGAITAEIIMVGGYYIYEGALLYGFAASAVNIIPNSVQGIVGIVVAVILIKIFDKHKIIR